MKLQRIYWLIKMERILPLSFDKNFSNESYFKISIYIYLYLSTCIYKYMLKKCMIEKEKNVHYIFEFGLAIRLLLYYLKKSKLLLWNTPWNSTNFGHLCHLRLPEHPLKPK